MTRTASTALALGLAIAAAAAPADAQSIYLNKDNIAVSVGPGTSAGNFHNTFNNGATIDKVIDAPSADAAEFHNQSTHIWFTADDAGGGLELLFDFQGSYDIDTLHFWNYDGESYDVDQVDFSFFDASNQLVGNLTVTPALGSSPAIYAQDIALTAPLNVQYVTAFLTGSNREVDFQNIGFTASVSAVPEPMTLALYPLGLLFIAAAVRRRLART